MSELLIPNPEKKRALIVVDVQEGFLIPETHWIINNIQKVLQAGKYTLVIEALFHAEPDSLWERQVGWTFPLGPTTKEIKDAFPVGTVTVTKSTKSAFKGDVDLEKVLKEKEIEEVHVAGLDTNDCVFATAQESFDLGFFTYVLEECTAASEGAQYREMALGILRELEMTNHSPLIQSRTIVTS